MTSWTSAAVALRPVVIAGMATLTMKKSSGARNDPTNRHASASQRFGSMVSAALGAVVAGVVIVASFTFRRQVFGRSAAGKAAISARSSLRRLGFGLWSETESGRRPVTMQ